MKSPRVSVLIPTYNYARYLPEAIESVLEQDWRDLELLISDDCSTDGSREVISRYAAQDSRVRFHIHRTNLGLVENWNWCLAEARGEYVKFLFGDDKLATPQALTKLVNLLDTNPSAVLAASARFVIDENSRVINLWDSAGPPGLHQGAEVIARSMDQYGNIIGEPSVVMFRRRAAARGFNVGYRQLVDLEMWFALLETGDLAYASEPLCCFRQHARQQTEANRSNQLGDIEIARLFWEYRRKAYLAPYGLRRLLFRQAYKLKKQHNVGAESLRIERGLLDDLGRLWYAAYWSHYKLTRPFQNLGRWQRRRRHKAALRAASNSGRTKEIKALAQPATPPTRTKAL